MLDIYSEIVKALEKKEKLALATLITRMGSAPRGVGAKYLIRGDGTSLGSIGGGCVEAEVWQEAQRVIETGKGGVLHFRLSSEQLAEGGLICGGNIDILVEPLRPEFLKVYQEVVRIVKKGGSAVLATLISIDSGFAKVEGSKVLIRHSGEKAGFLFDGGLEKKVYEECEVLLEGRKPRVLSLSAERPDSEWKNVEILLEPILSEPTVYIFGAGHVSEQLAPLAKRDHFKVVVIDDREMFANRERFPEADEVIVLDFERCFETLMVDDSSYIVIVTRGHLFDGVVLERAVRTDACYIGMIGSRKKILTLYNDLLRKRVSKEVLAKVHAPIGIEINSETPEEIAVSIAAELIKVRGQPFSKS